MNKYYSKILSITNTTYNTSATDIILLPYGSNIIEYEILVSVRDSSNSIVTDLVFDEISCFLVNSKTGQKYTVSMLQVSEATDNYLFKIVVDREASEDSYIDYIEIFLTNSLSSIFVRKNITTKLLSYSNAIFSYSTGNTKIVDSNLMSGRLKTAFASWSTPHKNTISNITKMLEPLYSVFSDSYYKTNEYLKQSYQDNYQPESYSRIFLKNTPSSIYRIYGNDTKEELVSTTNIYSSIKKVENIAEEESIELFKIILDPNLQNTDELLLINSNLPKQLYLKKVPDGKALFIDCVIIGLNEFGDSVTETILVREDLYIKTQNTFFKIFEINTGSSILDISNYVDCRYNHYVISNPFIIPAIVDRNFKAFKPQAIIKSNSEYTNNILTINNGLVGNGYEEYRFNFDHNNIEGAFISENLDLIYVKKSIAGVRTLNYSLLSTDFSKNIFNNKTLNNNPFISVSDTATPIGDWLDVFINTTTWFETYSSKALLIQARNRDNIYYYNQDEGILSLEKSFVYLDKMSSDDLNFSIFIENEDPYIFTVYDETHKIKASACSVVEKIKDYYSENLTNDASLVHYNGKLCLVNLTNPSILEQEIDSNTLNLFFNWENYPILDFIIKFENTNYYINHLDSNLPSEMYERINNSLNLGGPLGIKIYLNKLNLIIPTESLVIKVGSMFNTANGIVDLSKVNAQLIVNTTNNNLALTLNPKLSVESPFKTEYKLTITPLNITSELDTTYDT